MNLLYIILTALLALGLLFVIILACLALYRFIKIKLSKEIPFLMDGMEFLNRQDYDSAIKKFNRALEIKKDCSEALYGIGLVYRNKGDNDKAMEYFQKTIDMKERSPSAYHEIGWIYHQNNEFDKAIEYYVKAISMNRKFIQSHMNIGLIYEARGEFEFACEKYEDVIFLDPKYTSAYTSMADVYLKVGAYNEVIEVANRLEKETADSIDASFLKGVAYHFLNDTENLNEIKKKLSSINPVVVQDLDQMLKNYENSKLMQQQANATKARINIGAFGQQSQSQETQAFLNSLNKDHPKKEE